MFFQNCFKIGRDHRDIVDMRLWDHFFHVQWFPKNVSSAWEVHKLKNLSHKGKRKKMALFLGRGVGFSDIFLVTILDYNVCGKSYVFFFWGVFFVDMFFFM